MSIRIIEPNDHAYVFEPNRSQNAQTTQSECEGTEDRKQMSIRTFETNEHASSLHNRSAKAQRAVVQRICRHMYILYIYIYMHIYMHVYMYRLTHEGRANK